jgi:hypothetical protein
VKKAGEDRELRASVGPKGKGVRRIKQNSAFSYCDTPNMSVQRPRLVHCSRSSCAVLYEKAQSIMDDTCSMYGRAKKNSVHLFG